MYDAQVYKRNYLRKIFIEVPEFHMFRNNLFMKKCVSFSKDKCMRYLLLITCFLNYAQPFHAQDNLCDSLEYYAEGIQAIDLESLNYHLNVFVWNSDKRYKSSNVAIESDRQYYGFHRWLSTLENPDFDACLNHEDGRVVALALLSVYYLYDVNKIYAFERFLEDERKCFKMLSNRRGGRFYASQEEQKNARRKSLESAPFIPLKKLATALMQTCFRSSGYGRMDQDLAQYLQDHKDLKFGYGHSKTLYYRSKSADRFHMDNAVDHRAEFKLNHIALLPEPERSMYTLMMEGEDYIHNNAAVFKQADILEALNRLGREEFLNILARKPNSKDPDLYRVADEDFFNYDYSQMCKVILKYADQFLEKEDVQFLLDRATMEKNEFYHHSLNMKFAEWYIACANLDPKNAENYFDIGIKQLDANHQDFDRARIYQCLLDMVPEKKDRAFNWFYSHYSLNKRSEERPDHMVRSLENITSIKALVLDKRFLNKCRIEYVCGLARRLNELCGEETIPSDMINNVRHPYGVSSIETKYKKAKEEYPEETATAEQNASKLKQALVEYFN